MFHRRLRIPRRSSALITVCAPHKSGQAPDPAQSLKAHFKTLIYVLVCVGMGVV